MRCAVAVVAILLFGPQQVEAAPTITFQTESVEIGGLTPGGQLALYGVAHEFSREYPTIQRWARQLRDDRLEGRATFDLGHAIPEQSLWVAVDLATGLVASASPRAVLLHPAEFRGDGVTSGPGGPGTVFRSEGRLVDLFLVRPGAGAWLLVTGDGGGRDTDGVSDGSVSALLVDFAAVGESPATPHAFVAGDIVVVVDPRSLDFSVLPVR